MYKDLIHPPEEVVKKTTDNLKIETQDTVALFRSLSSLIRLVLFRMCTDAASVAKVFPDNFHKNLKELLSKIIAENLSNWRSRTISNQVSLPKLIDFDWRVDIKSSSDSLSRMSVPTCILQLKIQEDTTNTESVTGTQSLNVELSKEKLEAMLDGLGKIRGQLNSVAKRN
ncbi:putative COMM domain-containing protein 9-like [Apostichopus japonicus]|uniref:Putative COMM domain-containing protein 9-like n=1 Tax=Stichopus japonicus TaxID=307972 RepID=A0A2G8JIH1_STIJA|nr:putative COMM domain-containing protein 9-like [Apostichopus japonicus]